MLTITTKIDSTVKKYSMLSVGDRVVAGVSGGADSMLMLTYLLEKRDEFSLDITVANVEHGIRGESSVNDSRFVENFCRKNNVRYELLSINAVEEAERLGLGVEEYSRNRRYEFFSSFESDKIATAHNQSDCIETLLFRISRGTGLKGACSIPATRGKIIRPLIELSSSEIREACMENEIPFVIDETNNDNAYSRNYVRNVIIPDFKILNAGFEKSASRFIESVNEAYSFIDEEVNKCFDDCFDSGELKLKELRKYHKTVIKLTIQKMMSYYGITLDENHLSGVYELVFSPSRLQLKGSLFALSNKSRLRIVDFSGSVENEDAVIKTEIMSREEFIEKHKAFENEKVFFCDYDKIVGSISVRYRENGDEIVPAGRNVTKSLKKLYNEYQIPVEDRATVPVICDGKGIIGILGYCCSERVKIDNTTNNVIIAMLEDKG